MVTARTYDLSADLYGRPMSHNVPQGSIVFYQCPTATGPENMRMLLYVRLWAPLDLTEQVGLYVKNDGWPTYYDHEEIATPSMFIENATLVQLIVPPDLVAASNMWFVSVKSLGEVQPEWRYISYSIIVYYEPELRLSVPGEIPSVTFEVSSGSYQFLIIEDMDPNGEFHVDTPYYMLTVASSSGVKLFGSGGETYPTDIISDWTTDDTSLCRNSPQEIVHVSVYNPSSQPVTVTVTLSYGDGCPQSGKSSGKSRTLEIVGGIVGGVVVLALIWYLYTRFRAALPVARETSKYELMSTEL